MSDSKILLTYQDDQGNYQVECVWATKEGAYYRINNIPFFASNIALDDVISAKQEDNALYFDVLVEASGHSTIQIIIFNEAEVINVGKELEKLGCTWEGSHIKNLLSVDIPKSVSYQVVKDFLDNGENEGKWSYKEACLAHDIE